MQNETEIRIVPMNASHIAEIAEIERQCFSEPWSEKSLAEELNVPSAVFLTALAGGRVAGYCRAAGIQEEKSRLGTYRGADSQGGGSRHERIDAGGSHVEYSGAFPV